MDYYNVDPAFRALNVEEMETKVAAKSSAIFEKLENGQINSPMRTIIINYLEEASTDDKEMILIDDITTVLNNFTKRTDHGAIFNQDRKTYHDVLEILRKNKIVYLDAQLETHKFVLKLIEDKQCNLAPDATTSMNAEKVIFHMNNSNVLQRVTHLDKELATQIKSYQTTPSTPKMMSPTTGLFVLKN